ncbi:hypothetical protein ACNQGB_02155 [Flavobacterium sp. XS1P32]|uniref:hypothetical protein n=1 Tax=Flavobacterium sp. XS1P32 TaxID=3401726 RepID=UPI003AB04526
MTFNRKNKILLLSFGVMLYLCYSFAISNTINYYQALKSKEALIENSIELPVLIPQLKYKEKQLDKYLMSHEIKTKASFQNELLKQLTFYTNQTHVKITDFKAPHQNLNDKNDTTTSYIFSLEGTFINCLKTINYLENKPELGVIKHLFFVKKKNYKIDKDELYVEVILQKNS